MLPQRHFEKIHQYKDFGYRFEPDARTFKPPKNFQHFEAEPVNSEFSEEVINASI